ncbi:DEAD/DEAH box helicase domain-containing protein [Methanococcoides vulcani]|uniref:DEAD/DEAH box helicase domain-containing protein n=1 Tax=Methanococcoides vulcani TaxID=1353158 RepID=A0A1H9ZWB8_9EURY|nr:DEAD/DEAH box helicase [Methanococcoides vulcani]SES85997.1 DEAD/DEAH box helicase domain-containing protein [Methanococcoides vulcani]
MDVPELINVIRSSRRYEGQIVHVETIPSKEPEYGEVSLKPLIMYALSEMGIKKLYTHQAEAIRTAKSGEDLVLSTSTASGKSLCYMLPIFETLMEDPNATALYISPLNALVNDQLDTFRDFRDLMGIEMNINRFIGTMSSEEKSAVKYGNPRILFTNPEMLHLSFLQWKHQWKKFLSNLKFIVLDESHSYSGVMGSNMANLLRRLNRVCDHYGAKPQYICCTATIGNPKEHTSALIGKEVTLVNKDGSGGGMQKFIFWNPPLYSRSRSNNFTLRKASFGETVDLFTTFVQNDLQTIVFARSRQKVERMYVEAKQRLEQRSDQKTISPYRGGYHGNEREAIEKGLSNGNITGVISTTALELGIDIGGLDACIMDGFPGTIMSARQQSGRAGRGSRESVVALVADSNALDQYYMRNPTDLFKKDCEEAVINVSNRYIQAGHLLCAAREIALRPEDEKYFGSDFAEIMAVLEEEGLIEGDHEKLCTDGKAHMCVSIRGIEGDGYTIFEKGSRAPLEKDIGRLRAYREAFKGAVYINKGTPYSVTELDHEKQIIRVEKAKDGYYTRSQVASDIHIVDVIDTKPLQTCDGVTVGFGDVDVTQQVTGFKRFRQRTDEEIGQSSLTMPKFSLETEALWLELPENFTDLVEKHERDFNGGIHAIEHAIIAMYPLHLLADRNDVGGVSTPEHIDLKKKSGIFVYDGHAGGVGYAEAGYGRIVEMLEVTLKAIESCPCRDGCPSCIQSPKCGNNNSPLDKDAAIMILRKMLGKPEYIPKRKHLSEISKQRPGSPAVNRQHEKKDQNDPADALNRARRKLKRQGSGSAAEWIKLGIAAGRDKKDHKKACDCFDKALQLEPDNSVALSNKGITYIMMGKHTLALQCFNRLLDLGYGKSHVVWKNKGTALRLLGDRTGAIEAYNEALRLKPDDAGTKGMRDKLREADNALYGRDDL